MPMRRWNSSGIGGVQTRLVAVVGYHEGDGPVLSRIRSMTMLSTSASSGAMTRSRSCVGLGRGDVQQRDELAGGGQPVLDQAVVRQLGQFLDPDARVAAGPPRSPRPRTRCLLPGSGPGACRLPGPRPRCGLLARGQHVTGAASGPPAVNSSPGRAARAASSRAAGCLRVPGRRRRPGRAGRAAVRGSAGPSGTCAGTLPCGTWTAASRTGQGTAHGPHRAGSSAAHWAMSR